MEQSEGRMIEMAVTYLLSVALALFSGALPAQILGIIWEPVCADIAVDIPYISLLRLLCAAGAVLAVVISDRIHGYILVRDLIVGAIALEAMSLIGFSMSREFWNLGIWITAIGFAGGLCLSLLCYLLRETYSGKTNLVFISSALGIAAGVYCVRYVLSLGRSWRTACQALAILQIILCMTVFLLRRAIMHDVAALLKKRRKEAGILRQRSREKLIKEKGTVDERSQNAYLVKLLFIYGSAICCGLLLLSACHLTFTALVSHGDMSADLGVSIITVCAGIAAGRAAVCVMNMTAGEGRHIGRNLAVGEAVTLAGLIISAVIVYTGNSAGPAVVVIRILTGCGGGMIFPNLIQMEDERFDDEAQTAMAGLIPAFYLGAGAVITPFVQSMSGASGMKVCIPAMAALAVCMGVCLAFASVKIRR